MAFTFPTHSPATSLGCSFSNVEQHKNYYGFKVIPSYPLSSWYEHTLISVKEKIQRKLK